MLFIQSIFLTVSPVHSVHLPAHFVSRISRRCRFYLCIALCWVGEIVNDKPKLGPNLTVRDRERHEDDFHIIRANIRNLVRMMAVSTNTNCHDDGTLLRGLTCGRGRTHSVTDWRPNVSVVNKRFTPSDLCVIFGQIYGSQREIFLPNSFYPARPDNVGEGVFLSDAALQCADGTDDNASLVGSHRWQCDFGCAAVPIDGWRGKQHSVCFSETHVLNTLVDECICLVTL